MNFSAPILFAFVLLVSAAALAGPITKEMGDQYYENCLKGASAEGTMSQRSQATFCKCTSEKMQDNMTTEDIQALAATGDPAARAALNKVLEFVQAPCLQAPVHDMIAKKCQADIGKPQVCNCLSQKMGEYTEQQAVQLMGKILKQNPNIVDPMAAIVDSEDFQTTQKSIALSCLTNTQ